MKDNNINNQKKSLNQEEKSNKVLFIAIIFLPFFSLVYLISKHSNILINKRISIFSLIMIFLLIISMIYGLFKEIKLKRKKYEKVVKLSLSTIYISFFITLGILLYGNNSVMRDFIIDKAMQTTNHQYLATWFFDNETINESLQKIKESTIIVDENNHIINFDEFNYEQSIYTNQYDEEILTKENENDLYKIIKITGTTIDTKNKYNGYLVAIYDSSKIKLAISKENVANKNYYGEILSDIAKNNNAEIAINAGGFYSELNSNVLVPDGLVIKDGKILSNYNRSTNSSLIGFNYDNQLILEKITAEEAIKKGIRDAVDCGPYLIINGENQYTNTKKYGTETSRTAIGQRKDGIVLFLVINGGKQPESYGASYADIAKIMEQYGAINAANLDGGTSSALVEKNEYINNPWNGYKRTTIKLPNAWIVVK